jgi:hypothetical protein
LLAHGRWFSPGTPASSTTKTGRHDIAEVLLKVVLNTKNQIKSNLIKWREITFTPYSFCIIVLHSHLLSIFIFPFIKSNGNFLCVIDNAEKHVLSIWDWQKERNVAKTTVSFVSAKYRTHTQHIRQTSIQSNNNNKNFDNHGYRNQENEKHNNWILETKWKRKILQCQKLHYKTPIKKIVETEGTIDIRKTHIFISAHYSESILITSGVVKIVKRVQTSTILNNAEIQV